MQIPLTLKNALTAGLLFFVTGIANAQSGTELLNNFMQNVKTLDAIFTQEVVSDQGQITQTSYGNFKLKRPGKFLWEYQTPAPQKIISDSKNIWIYDIELEQVTVKPLSSAIGSTPAAILVHNKNFAKDYVILEKPAREGLQWVDMRPKDKSGDFTRILVGLDDAGIQAMDLYDQFGQVTMIRFRESNFNVPLSDSQFKFSPPEGVDVIGNPS